MWESLSMWEEHVLPYLMSTIIFISNLNYKANMHHGLPLLTVY